MAENGSQMENLKKIDEGLKSYIDSLYEVYNQIFLQMNEKESKI